MQSITIVTPPAIEPVTLEEAKLFLRVDGTAEDTMIEEFIAAARQLAEEHTRRTFLTTVRRLTLDRFPVCKEREDIWWDGVREGAISMLLGGYGSITLAKPPLIAVTDVTVYDSTDTPVTLDPDEYQVDSAGSRLSLRDATVLPSLRSQAAVEVTYTAGYGATADKVPAPIRLAIKQTVAAMYSSRECSEMPGAALTLLAPYRIMSL